MEKKKILISLRKYLIAPILVLGWTLIILLFTPVLGRPIIVGYILIFIFVSFFQESKLVLLTGLFTLLSYIYLFFYYPENAVLQPILDITLLSLCLIMVNFIVQNLIKTREEIEISKAVLEIKVEARTRELSELAEQREEIIKERTKELRKKIEELERFQRLAVGRELKMIELKEEVKKIREELGKVEKLKIEADKR